MNLRNSLLTGIMLLVFAVGLFAQGTTDTIPYRISYYELKKAQTVSSVAKSLKVDPITIVKLNRLKSTEQELQKGRRLKVPLYGKGVVYISPVEKEQLAKKEADKKAKEKSKEKKPEAGKSSANNDVIIIQDVKPKEEKPKEKPVAGKSSAKKQKAEKPQPAKSAAKKNTGNADVIIVEDVKAKEEKPKDKPKAEKPVKEQKTDPKPAKKEAAAKKQTVEKEVKPKQKPEDKKTDGSMATLAKEVEKEKAASLQQAREKLKQDSIKMEQQRQATAALRAKEGVRANYDPEIDQNNLMLVDATLELNEAMLAGVKASLDTLNAPDPPIRNSNDVKEILQRMKRAKDRQQLKPYLEYMNDSLTLDCKKLRTQREDIMSRLTPYLDYQHKLEAATNAPAEVSSTTASNAVKPNKKKDKKKPDANVAVAKDTIATKPIADINTASAKRDKNKQVKASTGADTVIIVDLGKPKELKPAKEKNAKPVASSAKKDTIQKTVTADKPVPTTKADTAVIAKEPEKAKNTEAVVVAKYDTVKRAVKPTPTTTKTDTVVIAKAKDKKTEKTTKPEPAIAKKDTVKKTDIVVTDRKTKQDTIIKTIAATNTQKKDTTAKVEVKPAAKTTASATTANTTSPDTIQNIKSQFFLRRAQKAIAEKKPKLAEEYLLKSIELWKDNYEAWMTLGDQEAQSGSPVKALADYQQCVRIDSTMPRVFYKIASLQLVSKKKTEAIQYFTRAISIDSTYLLAYMGRASIYGDYKQYDLALADYDMILHINRSYHKAYKERGMIKQLTRNFSEAVDDFTRYLIFEDTDPSAYYYRGLAKIGNKELLEGCIDLEKSADMGYEAAAKAMKKSCE